MAATRKSEKHSNHFRNISDYIGLYLSAGLLLFGAVFYVLSNYSHELTAEDSGRLKIVTSISPLYSHVKSTVGDSADVTNIVDPGVSPHDYQFSPDDVKAIAKADILVINGLGLEEWIYDVIEASDNDNLKIIDSSIGIEIIDTEGHDEHELGNPHIWLSPMIAYHQGITILEGILTQDKTDRFAASLRENHLHYSLQLQNLDKRYKEVLDSAKITDIAVFHSAYDYLARDYGLNIAVVLEETPGKEPTAKELADASQIIRSLGIKAIFKEPQFSPKLVETLAEELDLHVYELDPIGSEVSEDNYLNVMEKNLLVLEEALNL